MPFTGPLFATCLTMSYILEALKKSSEARARLTPDAAPLGPALPDASRATGRSARWPLAAIGIGALSVAAFVGIGALQHDDVRVPPPAAKADELASIGDAARTADVAQVQAPTDAPPAKAKARPAKDRAAENQPGAAPADAAPPPQRTAAKSAPPHAPAPASVAAAPPGAEARGDMPPELLRQVMAIPISAHIYSSKPAERMVIIDGRAVREGDSLPAGVLIEQITPTGISVSFQGYRANRPVH